MGDGWAISIIFVIAMIASTTDTLQSAMTALLLPRGQALPQPRFEGKMAIIITAMALINVPAIMWPSWPSILSSSSSPTSSPPPWSRRCSSASGIVSTRWQPWLAASPSCTVLVTFAVGEHWNEGFDVMVGPGGLFTRAATYAFVFTPLVSGLVTVGISLRIPGYKFAGYPTATKDVQMTTTSASAASATPSDMGVSSC